MSDSRDPQPRCSVFIAATLDGFIARSDDRIDFLSIVERAGEDYGYGEFWKTIDALVVGRKTYDVARGFDTWPYTGKVCVVLTRDPSALASDAKLEEHGVRLYAGDLAELVVRLGQEGVRRIYVDGGGVIQQFLDEGLIDDMTISTLPILLGDGIRLFGKQKGDIHLEVTRSRAFPSGLVQTEYVVKKTR